MQLPPLESIPSIPSHLRLHCYWPIQPLPLAPTNETSGVGYTSADSPYGQYILNHITNTGTTSMIGVGKSAARTSETGSPPTLRHSSHRYGIPSDLVLTLVFVQFRVADHIVTIVNILSHLCGCCESKSTTAGDSSTWYGVSYSKVRHPQQRQDSAITGGQRGNVGVIRRMTRVENRLLGIIDDDGG